MNGLFYEIASALGFKVEGLTFFRAKASKKTQGLIPITRSLYLREIAEAVRAYNRETEETAGRLKDYEACERALELSPSTALEEKLKALGEEIGEAPSSLVAELDKRMEEAVQHRYTTLAGSTVSKVAIPRLAYKSEKYRFAREENLPGFFPFTQGVFPFKRKDEVPRRMFAGEGGPKRTNRRFHYLSQNDRFKRLSTAFDSITLYGEDPSERPDIFGKIGESGVSVATLDDMEDLFSGIDLTNPSTSVSMTINGPAPSSWPCFFPRPSSKN